MADLLEDVACPVCGCICDDLSVEVEKGKIIRTERACSFGDAWFRQAHDATPSNTVDGHPATYDEAVLAAAQVIQQSRAPLVYGLSSSTTKGVRAACQLAETIGATLDSAAAQESASVYLAMQSVGMSTATLGEVRNRADLVIYWGCDPMETHPRHVERFVNAAGRFVPEGRKGRQLIVLDRKPTATAEEADHFIELDAGEEFEFITALRAGLKGLDCSRTTIADVPLVEAMKACRYGIIFFGSGLTDSCMPQATVEALLLLVRELNAHTRFTACPLHEKGDAGVAQALTWQTGFPCSLNFSRGYPQYKPEEFSASTLLENEEVDAVVVVGSESVEKLTPTAQQKLDNLPVICLASKQSQDFWKAKVHFVTAVNGIHRSGTVYRMDGVPIPTRQLLANSLPSEVEVLLDLEKMYRNEK